MKAAAAWARNHPGGRQEANIELTENERLALATIRKQSPSPQALLTSSLGLTQQSISRIVGSLTVKGLVNVGPALARGKRGKPSPSLTLNASTVHALGISIMADSVATGLIDFSGALLGQELAPVPVMDRANVLQCITRQVERLLAGRNLTLADVCGVGVAMTGYFMGPERTFNPPGPLRHWMGVDIAALVSQHLGRPAWAENDGNAAAIGEAALGVGRRVANFAYLYFSAGFGGGVVVNGKLLEGRFGNSGEFAGILPYNIYAHPNLELLRQCVTRHGTEVASIHALVANFDPAWPGIDDWVVKVKDSLSLVASACSAILDTEAIVLGGLLPRALAEKVIPEIEFYSSPRWGTRRPVPELLPAEAPGDAALFGAASIPFEKLFF